MSLALAEKYTRDYWCPEDLISQGGIAVKEAKALFQTLTTFSEEVFNGRVDAFVDNSNLIDFWNNGGGKNIPLTNEIKDLFHLSLKLNIVLNLFYIPSESNDADSPSRAYSDSDCSLAGSVWDLLQPTFGPHSVDMMALPSNVMKDQMTNLGKPSYMLMTVLRYLGAKTDAYAQELLQQGQYKITLPS